MNEKDSANFMGTRCPGSSLGALPLAGDVLETKVEGEGAEIEFRVFYGLDIVYRLWGRAYNPQTTVRDSDMIILLEQEGKEPYGLAYSDGYFISRQMISIPNVQKDLISRAREKIKDGRFMVSTFFLGRQGDF